jgi:hypothetical protein
MRQEEYIRNYPTLVQAQAFVDGLRLAGWDGEYRIHQSPDRYAPLGAWYEVIRVHGGADETL